MMSCAKSLTASNADIVKKAKSQQSWATAKMLKMSEGRKSANTDKLRKC